MRKGDIGVVVEHLPAPDGTNDGYILEFFDAQGTTVGVLPVLESDLEFPRPNTVLTFRELEKMA
ncbi:MAG: DUF4926 domain-containing protein [Sphingobacteriaceae bacterium]|nr:DUF4926 domain-containing protein [Cytophagaceae bacterium]